MGGYTAERALQQAFRYRYRGTMYSDEAILITDFDIKNLRVFVVKPPQIENPYLSAAVRERFWNTRAYWSVEERRMTDEEFAEINALCANFDPTTSRPVDARYDWLEPIGYDYYTIQSHGEQVRVQAYIRRPRGDKTRWTVSLDIDDIKARHGEVFEDA